ncbi:glycosyltransferase family 2 protein, partial [Acinetobacter indicus]|uniref:glycosyltransferase family 2 protein n=1 Tax=Acinetobacter indicus TaxID=756892 RepID=UPI00131563D4
MNGNQPLVTVYIPTYNRLELLQRAVKSVQEQTYHNLEIIIVDDCSTDGTHEYLEKVSKEDKRVRYFLKEKNSGACVSRNIAIKNSKGEFITGLDDDDYFERNRIEIFLHKWFSYSEKYIALFSEYKT